MLLVNRMIINYNSTFPYIQNIICTVVTTLLDYYSGTVVFLEDKFTYSYNKYGWFKLTVDKMKRYKNDFINYMYNIKTYPEYNWHNTVHIVKHFTPNTYEYNEKYEKITEKTNEQSFMKGMRDFYHPLYNCENKNYVCLLSKFNDIFCVQHTPVYLKNNDIFEKSNMSILSVTYSHPSMEENIELSIPKTMLYCHNQLFNFAFVYHCLQYQDKPYIFDEQYKIEIMDSDVNMVEISTNQYLHIYKDELKVQELVSDNEHIQ
mgnify:CR=1 FL=1